MPFSHLNSRELCFMSVSLARITGLSLLIVLISTYCACDASAGIGLGQNQAVGGVIIDPDGNVRAATAAEQATMAGMLKQAVGQPVGDLADSTAHRVISLNGLQNALRETHESGSKLSEELSFLVGMQRIETVVVDEENHDLLLVGPAEPWQAQDDGSVVGKHSGGSVVRLDDLVTAFRSVEQARQDGGIRCSIEPTAEGRQRLRSFLQNIKLRPGQNPAFLEAGMRQAFGPQMVKLAGVPAKSRFARTLIASDFEMKRIAMGLTQSPVAGLPSYLQMAKNARQSSTQSPRWWMACDYEPIARGAGGKVWQLSGQGVRTMTEEDIVTADGNVVSDGRKNPLAVKWADTMTQKFKELSIERPVFRDLRNAMDLAVIATLITQEQLDSRSGVDLSVLRGDDSDIETAEYYLPKSLEPQCSFIHGRAGWTVTASGGVNLNAFGIAENQVPNEGLQTLVTRVETQKEQSGKDRWWWDLKD